jgi:hypothetical protein
MHGSDDFFCRTLSNEHKDLTKSECNATPRSDSNVLHTPCLGNKSLTKMWATSWAPVDRHGNASTHNVMFSTSVNRLGNLADLAISTWSIDQRSPTCATGNGCNLALGKRWGALQVWREGHEAT